MLLQETIPAVRAAARNRLQSSLDLALGSGVLTALGSPIAIITYGTGRPNVLGGIVRLVLLATFIFVIFAP